MSTTVPEPIQEVEQKVADATPEALKTTEAQVAADFNTALSAETVKAEAAVPGIDERAAGKDPALVAAIQDAEKGNIAGVLSEIPAATKEVKAGYKTTEFWMTLLAVILTQVGALRVPGKYGDTIQTTALIGAYALSRGIAK